MSIALEASSTLQVTHLASSATFALNISGTNPATTVTVHSETGPTTSVTYNGTALTSLAYLHDVDDMEIWGLIAPTAGTHNVVVTYSGVASDATSQAVAWSGVSAFGDKKLVPSPSANESSSTATLTTVAGDVVINNGVTWAASTTTATNGETELYNTTYTALSTTIGIQSAYILASGATRVTGWTKQAGTSYMDLIAVVLTATVASSNPTSRLLLLGVGS